MRIEDLNAKRMLIAQVPQNEDGVGKMLIGPSRKVLDELLKRANITRGKIYQTIFLRKK